MTLSMMGRHLDDPRYVLSQHLVLIPEYLDYSTTVFCGTLHMGFTSAPIVLLIFLNLQVMAGAATELPHLQDVSLCAAAQRTSLGGNTTSTPAGIPFGQCFYYAQSLPSRMAALECEQPDAKHIKLQNQVAN